MMFHRDRHEGKRNGRKQGEVDNLASLASELNAMRSWVMQS